MYNSNSESVVGVPMGRYSLLGVAAMYSSHINLSQYNFSFNSDQNMPVLHISVNILSRRKFSQILHVRVSIHKISNWLGSQSRVTSFIEC